MKYSKHLIFLVTFFALANICLGQDERKAVLVDEYSSYSCGDFRGRVDAFMAELADHSQWIGYVVNSGSANETIAKIVREEMIKAQVKLRRFDATRIEFARADAAGEPRTQLWRIQNWPSRPSIENVNNSYSLPEKEKPFVLVEDSYFNDSECPDVDYPRIVSNFLTENPHSRSNVVVYGTTIKEIERRERMAIQALVSKYKVDRKRLQLFRRIGASDPENPKGVEYWYLP